MSEPQTKIEELGDEIVPGEVRAQKLRKRRPVPPPQEMTVAQRLAATKNAAAELDAEQKTKIMLRLGAPLELHEGMVKIGQKVGAKVPNVALRCMALGMAQWARELKILLTVVPVEPLTVFERNPPLAKVQTYGVDEATVREELRAAAEQRDQMAADLHIPGRRRAAG